MDGNPERMEALGACEWCGKDAHQRLVLRPGGKTVAGYRTDVTALVCPAHYAYFHSQDEVGEHPRGDSW